ncbi:MAG: YggS family pyridoxal phosphate-dependent enzyme [Clostridiales bacterium]|nr:YggS family pyridoxal phosphate-dependent enzyme [Clostridiales bacterium]
MSDELKRNLYSVLNVVDKAAARVGSRVTVVAATKTVSAEVVSNVIELGIKDVGENRVQEYLAKKDGVKGAEWHFIGTLQRNKAKYLVGNVSLIQSVSNLALAEEIDRLAAKRGIVQSVLVELNAGDEPNKTGAKTCEIDALIERVGAMKNLSLRGLMAVPPKNATDAVYRSAYGIFEKHRGGAFDILSVGMSGDYERAIEFGSNMVRIGTAIFGQRAGYGLSQNQQEEN